MPSLLMKRNGMNYNMSFQMGKDWNDDELSLTPGDGFIFSIDRSFTEGRAGAGVFESTSG